MSSFSHDRLSSVLESLETEMHLIDTGLIALLTRLIFLSFLDSWNFFYRNNIHIHKEIIKGILLQIMSSPQELQVTQLTNEL